MLYRQDAGLVGLVHLHRCDSVERIVRLLGLQADLTLRFGCKHGGPSTALWSAQTNCGHRLAYLMIANATSRLQL